MTQELWTAVDEYSNALLVGADPALDAARERSQQSGLPDIAVSPSQGKFLSLLARIHGAKKILEFGALGGYSTIWLARALPADGRLITLEADPKHADVAKANIASAGFEKLVDVRVGKALDTLPKIDAEGPFDFVFIDADKANIPAYFTWTLEHSHPGSVIVVDNVVRDGRVIEAESTDPSIQGIRRFNEMLAKEPRVSATTIQTVGSKGYDGFTLAVVNA
ncbi:putative O-methyltransferase YrrM [Silvibacterium bohemicum]|uniref:Putative O-methyltransferase YrrM n=1 Tax=Silvibacterium bohemicum TaxID=1577686 RepID=A0A841JPQ4_9BACT|nr:O-methyltransferase [Silvibacterium bohemicum]MBB6143303.1 putative O-methyltransferase YrrM [Silvibacterium bohemicum]